MEETVTEKIRVLMHANQRSEDQQLFTVPSPDLYPFQWQWDSCFHALIYNALGEHETAEAELRSVCARALPSGLLPHIIYRDQPKDKTNWGREMRGDVINNAWGVEGMSSITQPPIIARAVFDTYRKTNDLFFLEELYPILREHFAYLSKNRNYADTQLLYIINPDESGEDNAPRYDNILHLPSEHTPNEHLEKRIGLMKANATCSFATHTCMREYFGVVDVGFNVIYCEALDYMSRIAEKLKLSKDARMFETLSKQVSADIQTHMLFDEVHFSLNANTGQPLRVLTWNIFMPMYGGLVSQHFAKELVEKYLLNENLFLSDYGICTTAKTEPSYDPDAGFWRGPIWMAPHWFIYEGLMRYGFEKEAQMIKERSIGLIEKSGFREQYHPETGAGQGAQDFTWSGLTLLM